MIDPTKACHSLDNELLDANLFSVEVFLDQLTKIEEHLTIG